jgi:hypothetical protein
MRAMDLLASFSLFDHMRSNEKRVRPEVNLLIECKRSDMPFVFFSGEDVPLFGNFPHIAGLKSDEINIRTDDDKSSWTHSITDALSLTFHPFLREPTACVNMSKAVRKGPEVVLSGQDAYQGLVLPIRSAVEYFRASRQPRPTFHYFSAHLVIGVAILDAPMVSVSLDPSGKATLTMTPWQRLWRHEPLSDDFGREVGEVSAIDVIHKDFILEYLENHLLPFARQFGEAALRHDEELASGKGFVSGMGADSFSDLEDRLKPRTVSLPMAEDAEVTRSLPRAMTGLIADASKIASRFARIKRAQRVRPTLSK